MSGSLVDQAIAGFAWLGQFSDPLAWVVVAAFLGSALVAREDRELGRYLIAGAWVLFGVFWLTLLHHFAFVQKSIVEGVGVALAVPACLSVAVLLLDGRDSLFVLSRSVGVMGIVYLPFEAIPSLRQWLVETVTAHTLFVMRLIGYDPTVVGGMRIEGLLIADKQRPYWSSFVFHVDGEPLTYTILIACTGVGSMAIFAGLITAVDAPLERKLKAFAVSIPIIYGLNIVRNVFIALTLGHQKLQVFPDTVMALFAIEDEKMVSYFVADRIIAQSLSVVVLVGITWVVVRMIPEMLVVVEDALYVLTRNEYDLRGALGLDAVRADGDGSE